MSVKSVEPGVKMWDGIAQVGTTSGLGSKDSSRSSSFYIAPVICLNGFVSVCL